MSRNEENMPVEATIRRVLVANRGEIAIRVFDTAREMGITCVAVYSDADRDGRHVRAADLAVHLPGNASADTYLNIPAILAAAKRTEADAIHPGYGFLAENPEFAEAVTGAGLTWIGPPPEAIPAMALKMEAKNAAAAAGCLAAALPPATPVQLPWRAPSRPPSDRRSPARPRSRSPSSSSRQRSSRSSAPAFCDRSLGRNQGGDTELGLASLTGLR